MARCRNPDGPTDATKPVPGATRGVAGITVSPNPPGSADAVPAAGPTASGKDTAAQATTRRRRAAA
ncbi:hypothetical protein Saso_39620 [Streptomyces asoensis]|uniref:Uncharacterized protein n=1 Tax=Streptomyces asoensis TaxID=249586 RepID=A0ABQ3S2W9_9ACTN|nr:hypothetical protein GCM10010496_76400 [Streptomyces asoensis]GHI62312.1 hypothetical protein Saso_39620 [Streptomyces asoensis]